MFSSAVRPVAVACLKSVLSHCAYSATGLTGCGDGELIAFSHII